MFQLIFPGNSKALGWFRLLCGLVLVAYISDIIGTDLLRVKDVYAQGIALEPQPGVLLSASPVASLPLLKAISVNPVDPLKIDFLVDGGDRGEPDEKESARLIKYFLSFLTIPEKDLWVNLSPSEPDRIVNTALGRTPVGEDMLRQDYLLKQLAASMTFPDREPGKAFWEQVYAKIRRKYGDVDLPVNTFSKVWVVPQKAVVYEDKGMAFIAETRLKVMLDQDYVTTSRMMHGRPADSLKDPQGEINGLYLMIARDIIIPELEREVNEGRYFSELRQMFNSLVLAVWFKRKLQDHIINRVYTNKKKTAGIETDDKEISRKIYAQYMVALKKGVYDIIREDYNADEQDVVPRRYFSGGFSFQDASQNTEFIPVLSLSKFEITALMKRFGKKLSHFTVSLVPRGMSRKSLLRLALLGGMLFSSVTGPGNQGFSQTSSQASGNQTHVVQAPEARAPKGNVITWAEASGHIISLGDPISAQDQKYFKFMKDFLTPDDFKNIQGQKNVLTGLNYDFQWDSIVQDRDNVFSASEMGWMQEAVVIVAQHKLGIQEDGDFGPQTRQALEAKMNVNSSVAISKVTAVKPVVSKPVVKPAAEKSPQVKASGSAVVRTVTPAPAPAKPKPVVVQPGSSAVSTTASSGAGSPPPPLPPPSAKKVANPVVKPVVRPVTTAATASSVNTTPPTGSLSGYTPGYTVSTQSAVVLDEIGFVAQSSGPVSGFNERRQKYNRGDVVLRINDFELEKNKNETDGLLKIWRQRLVEEQALMKNGAATAADIAPIELKISGLLRDKARWDALYNLTIVRAPCELDARNILVRNGQWVNKGMKMFDYLAHQRVHLSFEVPLTQTYFGNMGSFKIDGEPVRHIIGVDWRPNFQNTGAVVTFYVEPSSNIPSSKTVHVDAEILPPASVQHNAVVVTGRAWTISAVGKSAELPIPASSAGAVQSFVREGDRVSKGQLLAFQSGSLSEEYNMKLEEYENGMAQIEAAAPKDGVQYISRQAMDELKGKAVSLKAGLRALQQQAGRMRITAPEKGIVTSLSTLTSSSFSAGDEIMRIKTQEVRIGDLFDMNAAVLLSDKLNVQVNDPVAIQTPSGEYVLGRISNMNTMPTSQSVRLVGLVAVEIVAQDVNNVLWKNLPVKIIVPTEAEKESMLAMFHQQGVSVKTGLAQSKAGTSTYVAASYRNPVNAAGSEVVQRPGEQQAVHFQKGGMTIQQLALSIAGNDILNGGLRLDLRKSQEAQRYTRASKFNLSLGVSVKDNKLTFSGGLGGIFQGISAIKSGNLAGAALPEVYNLSGELINKLSGKEVKQEALASTMTGIAQYHMQAAVADQVHAGTVLLIDMGLAQNNIDRLKVLLSGLQKASAVAEARASQDNYVTSDKIALEQKIADIKGKIAGLELKLKEKINELSFMLGAPATGVLPDLLWEGSFSGISDAEVSVLSEKLQGVQSQNYRIQEAKFVLLAMEQTIKLQKDKLFPAVELQGLYLPERGASFEIPIADKRTGILRGIEELQRQKVALNLKNIRADEDQKLTRAELQVNQLSLQIKQEEINKKNAYRALNIKLQRPDLYRADQMIAELEAVDVIEARLLDLKAGYFKAEANLQVLQVMAYNETHVQASTTRTSVQQRTVQAVQLAVDPNGHGPSDPHLAYVNVLEPTSPESATQNPVNDMTPVSVTYAVSGSGQNAVTSQGSSSLGMPGAASNYAVASSSYNSSVMWVLMAGAQNPGQDEFDRMLDILTQDPNVMTRTQTLDFLLNERQNNPKFLAVAEKIVLKSPYQDVVQKLLVTMVGRDGCDPRFFIYVIDQAIRDNKPGLIQSGFSLLNDMLTQSADAVKTLTEMNYSSGSGGAYARVAPESARRVFLTFLSLAPDQWIGKVRLLQSNYWTPDQLAGIHNALLAENNPAAQKLAGIIHDELLRREMATNLDGFFNKGPFAALSVFSSSDSYASYMFMALKEHDRRFLNSSPAWREAGQFMPSGLFSKAEDAVKDLLESNKASQGDLLYDLPLLTTGTDGLLGHIDLLDWKSQEAYVAKTQSLPELARILQYQPSLRGGALNRLMTTPDGKGRVLALGAYLVSDDDQLCGLIESRDLVNLLKKDIPLIDDPVSMDIIRRSMEKIYQRTRASWALDIRLRTYTFAELHAVVDPRGDEERNAQIQLLATEMAVGMVEESGNRRPFMLSGQSAYSAEELALLDGIKKRIEANDPHELDAYLKFLQATKNVPLIHDLIRWRDKVTTAIMNNDQSLSRLPSSTKGWFWFLGTLVVLGAYKIFRKKAYLKKAKVDDLICALRKDLVGEDPKTVHWKQKISRWLILPGAFGPSGLTFSDIPDTGLHNSSRMRLQKIQGLSKRWNEDGRYVTTDDVVNDLNQCLNDYYAILRTMPYVPELMGRGDEYGEIRNGKYQKTFHYFYLSILEVRNALDHFLVQYPDLNDRLRETLLIHQDDLKKIADYVTDYLDIFECRGSIDKIMGYKYDDRHWLERSGLYPVMRKGQLYDWQVKTSVSRIETQLPHLIEKGEALMPGLYAGAHGNVFRKSRDILTQMISRAETLHSLTTSKAADEDRKRRLWSRLFLYSMPFTLITATVCNMLAVPFITLPLTVGAIAGVLMRFFVFFRAQTNITKRLWLQDMARIMEKLDASLDERLQKSSFEIHMDQARVREIVIKHAVEDGLEQLKHELDPGHRPGVDMVMIVPDNVRYTDALSRYVQDRKGKIFRKDVSVEVVPVAKKGSANVYFEAMKMMRDRLQDESFLTAYPHLRGRALEDVKMMLVFHANNEYQDNGVLLDWAIINGYRVIGKATDEGPLAHGGQIIVYSRDVYFGPVFKFADKDINLMGDWVDKEELKNLGMLVVDKEGKTNAVSEVFEKLDIASLQHDGNDEAYPNKVLAYLKQYFDLDKESLRQFPALSGIMVFSPRVVGVLEKVLAGLQNDPDLWMRLQQLHMTSDILNVLLNSKKDVLRGYLEKRIDLPDIDRPDDVAGQDEARRVYRAFFNLLVEAKEDVGNNFEANAVLPAYGAAELIHIKDASGVRNVAAWLKQAGYLTDPAQVSGDTGDLQISEENGGVDFSAVTDRIDFKEEQGVLMPEAMPYDLQHSLQFLQLFRGFDFRISSFQPLEDPRVFLFH